jgi:hypothetical protein
METLGSLIIQLGFASAVAYVPLQIYACSNWHGGWRVAALMPLLLMVPVFIYTTVALVQQSNLWPIVLIFAAPIGTAYLLILLVIRRFVTARASTLAVPGQRE